MTDSPPEIAGIRRRLFALSDTRFAELVDTIERARAVAAGEAFSADALAAMRPRLRVARLPRRVTLLRLFCRPFEDLLADAPPAERRPGRIARRSIRPCWTVVSAGLDPDLGAALTGELGGLTVAARDWALRFGPRLWPAAAAAARAALRAGDAGPAERAALLAQLGGGDTAEDLARMARLLAVAETIEELRRDLSPAPLRQLGLAQAAAVAATFDALAGARDSLWEPLALFVIGRMADPAALGRALAGTTHPGLRFLAAHAADSAPGAAG